MPRSYKMYFDQKNRRWRKRYHGNQIYFPLKDEETKDNSYSRCWAEFLNRKKEIDAAPPPPTLWGLAALEAQTWVYDKAIREIEEVLAAADVFRVDKPPLEARLEELQRLRGGFDTGNPPPPLNFAQASPLYIVSHYATLDRQSQGKNLETLLQEFLKIKQQEVATKKISAGRWDTLQRHLHDLLAFVGPTSNPAHFDAAVLQKYYGKVLTDIAENKYSEDYAQSRFSAVKQFTRWLWKLGVIENLPRNMNDLQIRRVIKEVTIFPVEEIKSLLAAATGMLKLCILLMLNCGFQQKDISDLKPEEVDWDLGRIKRKRSKTMKEKGTPTIEYLLWRETFDLLKDIGKRDGESVLLGKNGNPLKWEKINAQNKIAKTDAIKATYSRFCRKMKLKPRPLKLLRKTGPSLIQKHPQFSSLYRLMLNKR